MSLLKRLISLVITQLVVSLQIGHAAPPITSMHSEKGIRTLMKGFKVLR